MREVALEMTKLLGHCVQENLEELATLESLDNGKPYVIAKTVDVPMASHSVQHARSFLHVMLSRGAESLQD